MECAKCGKTLPEGVEVCPDCDKEEMEAMQKEQSVCGESAKKDKKTMLYAFIGGGVALIALIVILCICFCGSKWPIEAGMNMKEVHKALTDEGFVLQDDYELYDKQKVYDGFIEGIGVVEVQTKFNKAGKIIYAGVLAEKEKAIPNYFLKEFDNYSNWIYRGPYQIGFYGGQAYEYYDDAVLDSELYGGDVTISVYMGHEEEFWLRNKDGVQSIMKDSWVGFFFKEYLPEKTRNELNDFINEIK